MEVSKLFFLSNDFLQNLYFVPSALSHPQTQSNVEKTPGEAKYNNDTEIEAYGTLIYKN